MIIETQSLTRKYTQNNNELIAVNSVNVSFEKGCSYAIVGKSGCGKSTLLRMLGGMEIPSEGRVFFDNKNINLLKDKALAKIRGQNFGFVYQSFNLLQELTVYDNIATPFVINNAAIDDKKINELLSLLDIADKKSSHPYHLSGGQQQKVAIARALVRNPEIVFADEPTGNLDEYNRDLIINYLVEQTKARKSTLIIVTHDSDIKIKVDHVLQMQDGKIL